MQLSDLPNDTLGMVLKYSLTSSDTPDRTLRFRLPLLSICRKWRQLALPWVYRTVFIKYGSKRLHRTIDSEGNYLTDGSPEAMEIKTNLDLVAASGCASVVSLVSIDIYYMQNPLPGHKALLRRMHSIAHQWTSVQSLTLKMFPFTSSELSNYHLCSSIDMCEVADALSTMLPGVLSVRLSGSRPSPHVKELYKQLAGNYSAQLQALESQYAIAVQPNTLFGQLKCVKIYGSGGHGPQLPQVCPENLEVLQLSEASASRWWTAFVADSSNREVNFPKLEVLDLVFASNGDGKSGTGCLDDGDWVLRFPALKSLILASFDGNCPTLKYAVLPSHMGALGITATPATFRSIASVTLPSVLHLKLCVFSETSSDNEVLADIDGLLASAGQCNSMELNIKVPNMTFQPERITCTGLTRLVIDASVSVDAMLALIPRLPRLDALTFYDLSLDDIQADLWVPGSRSYSLATPLDTKLRKLAINFSRVRHLPELVIPVAKYLLLSIPTLTEFLAPQTPGLPILAFMNDYYKQYPHMAGLTLKFYAEGRNIRRGV